MKPTIPYSMQQQVQMRTFDALSEAAKWLEDLTRRHTPANEEPYYLHIDHFQVLPNPDGERYHVIATYHRVYLQKGE